MDTRVECEDCGRKFDRPRHRLAVLCDFCMSRATCKGIVMRAHSANPRNVTGEVCGTQAKFIMGTSPRCERCYQDAKRAQARVWAALSEAWAS